jgi:hypothetical protein
MQQMLRQSVELESKETSSILSSIILTLVVLTRMTNLLFKVATVRYMCQNPIFGRASFCLMLLRLVSINMTISPFRLHIFILPDPASHRTLPPHLRLSKLASIFPLTPG